MVTITCPGCGFKGSPVDFSCSLADEICCPRCGWEGMLVDPEDGFEAEDEEAEED